MDSITFAWTLVATIFAGLQMFVGKIVAHERRDGAFNGLMMYGVSGVIAFGILLFHPWPHVWLLAFLFALGDGAIHSVGNYLRIKGLHYVDSVIYFPINKVLGPLLVVVAGVAWFADSLSLMQYIGVACSLTVPLLLLSGAERHRQNNLRLGLMLLIVSTALTSISVVFGKEALLNTTDVLFVVGIAQIAGAGLSSAILIHQRGVKQMVSHIDRRDIVLGLIVGILGFIGLKKQTGGFNAHL